MSSDRFASIDVLDLASVIGGAGGGWSKLPSVGKATGVGPSSVMEALDKPGKTLDLAKGMLGMPDSGRPGDSYTPASQGPDGGITPGRFDAPNPSGVSPPISE